MERKSFHLQLACEVACFYRPIPFTHQLQECLEKRGFEVCLLAAKLNPHMLGVRTVSSVDVNNGFLTIGKQVYQRKRKEKTH